MPKARIKVNGKFYDIGGVSGEERQSIIDDANSYADQLNQSMQLEIDEINDALNNLDTTLDDSVRDGIISEAEARSIKGQLNNLALKKAEMDREYTDIYSHTNINTASKSALQSAKSSYDTKYQDLVNTINNAISDSKATTDEVSAIDTAFSSYRNALSVLVSAIRSAVDQIAEAYTDKKIAPINTTLTEHSSSITQNAQEISQRVTTTQHNLDIDGVLSDAKAYSDSQKSLIDTDVQAVQSNLTATNDYIDNAFRDGVVYEAELRKIDAYRKGLEEAKLALDSRYDEVYANPLLVDEVGTSTPKPKTNLQTAKTSYQSKYDALLLSIDNAIADTIATPLESVEVNNAVIEYRDSLSLLVSMLEAAIDYIAQAKADQAESSVRAELNNFVSNVYNEDMADIRNQIDGNITTWFYAGAPTLTNTPAVDWTTDELKNTHLGDLYYDDSTGYSYRFRQLNGVYSWLRITDTDVTKALSDAAKAQDTADGKRRVFVTTPIPPYDKGDLWTQGSAGGLKRCIVAKTAGQTYLGSDWEDATNYDTRISEAESTIIQHSNEITLRVTETTYTSGISSVRTDAQGYANTAESNANVYADTKSSETLSAAQTYADTKASEAQTAAEQYALAQAEAERVKAEAYADGIVSAEEQARINDANAKLAEAKTHAETKATEAQNAAQAYADGKLVDYVTNTVYDGDMSSLQGQIDGKAELWFYNYVPTLANQPASSWDTEALKLSHVGDLFYNTSTGRGYRFALNNSVYSWSEVRDTDISAALSNASKAQDTADGKRRVFTNTPVTPYDAGDLWAQGTSGDLYRCKTSRATGAYVNTDWEKATKYTDDTVANENLVTAKTYAETKASEAQTAAQEYALAQAEAERVKAEAYADGKVSVEEQARINDANAKLAEAKSHAETKAGEAQTAAESYAKAQADAIQIGGKNLVRNSNFYTGSLTGWNINGTASVLSIDGEYCAKISGTTAGIYQSVLPENGVYTISFYAKGVTNTAKARVGFLNLGVDITTPELSTTEWKRFTLTTSNLTLVDSGSSILHVYWIQGEYYIRDIKVEKGTRITDWTPAPEDLEAATAKAQTDANTANSLLADLASDSKLTAVEKQDVKKEWDIIVSEKATIEGQATTYGITTEKTTYTNAYDALNTYITPLLSSLTTTSDIVADTFRTNFKTYYDARTALLKKITDTSKSLVDSAQSTANDKRRVFLATPTTPYEVGDLWTQGAGGDLYRCKVARLTGAYVAADWEKAVKYTDDTAVNNLKIGGRNLMRYRDNANNSTFGSSQATVTITGEVIKGQGDTAVNPSYPRILNTSMRSFVFELNTDYTISFYARSSVAAGRSFGICEPGGTNAVFNSSFNVSTEWQLVTYTFKPTIQPSATTNFQIYVGAITGDTTSWLEIKYLKLEKGTKATDWSQAPEDLEVIMAKAQTDANTANSLLADLANDNKLTAVEKQDVKKEWDIIVSEKATLEGQATTYGITTEKTTYTNAYNALNTYITPLLSSLTTTSDITATTFRSNFKTYYDARTALLKKITDTSKSLADGAQGTADYAKGQIDGLVLGGTNLIPNSIGELGVNNWSPSAIPTIEDSKRGLKIARSTSGELTAGSVRFRVEPNTQYTISGFIKTTANCKNIDVFFLSRNQGSTTDYDFARYVIQNQSSVGTFKFVSGTFTTTTDYEGYIRIDNNGSSDGLEATAWFAYLKMEKGNRATDWSPAPTDIDSKLGQVQGVTKVRYIRDWLNGSTANPGNHWVEIKAISGDVNRALNKSVTSSSISAINTGRLTDGSTDTNSYADAGNSGMYYMQIDLGAVYEDIDLIHVWHYYADGRTYYNTKVEVSENGNNWTTIFDSATSGTYKETADGLVVPVNLGRATGIMYKRMDSAEQKITPSAIVSTVRSSSDYTNDLGQKVGSSEIISKINQTAEAIKISASKVDIQGAVTFSSFDTSLQNTINAKATTTELNTAVTNIAVGGRNLLPGTKDMSANNSPSYNTTNKYGIFTIADATASATGYRDTFTDSTPVLDGLEYTVSFYAKSTNATQSIVCHFYNPNNTTSVVTSTGHIGTAADGNAPLTISNEWKRYWVTWKLSVSGTTQSLIVGRISGTGSNVSIAGVKFEKGNKATDWTPAPEDTEAYTDSKATTAETNAKTYTDQNTGNLVNNTTKTGTVTGWTGGATVSQQDFFGTTVPVQQVTTSGNVLIRSSSFIVDPSKAYEVTIWIKSDGTVGTDYYGMYANDVSGNTIGIDLVTDSSGTLNTTASTNPYFWNGSGSNHLNTWVRRTAYIMPAGTTTSDMKQIGYNVNTNARMLPNTYYISIRWLNYYNSATRTTWVANPKVVEVDPNAVIYGAKAKLDASAAQSTANTANTAAGNAQSTANTANSTANTANSTANSAKGTIDAWKAGGLVDSLQTSNTSNTYAGQLTKIGRFTVTGQYGYSTTDLAFIHGGNGSVDPYWAEISFRLKQQNAMGTAPYVSIHYKQGNYLLPSDFMYQVVQNDASASVVDLYLKIRDSYNDYKFTAWNQAFVSGSLALYQSQGFVSTLSGTTGTATDKSHNPTTSTVDTWKVPGKTTIDGANIETGTITWDKARGGTLQLGGANDVNGRMTLYDANGVLIADLNAEQKGFNKLFIYDVNSPTVVRSSAGNTDVTLYVSSDPSRNPSDDNDGLTSSTPLATLNAALDKIPRFIRANHTISVLGGAINNFYEDLNILGFMGTGDLRIIGNGLSSPNQTNLRGNVKVGSNGCKVYISAMKIISAASYYTTPVVDVVGGGFLDLYNTEIYGEAATHGIRVMEGGFAFIRNNKIFNCSNAMTASNGGRIYQSDNTSSGSYGQTVSYGLYASGGIIQVNGLSPYGSTSASLADKGGTIIGTISTSMSATATSTGSPYNRKTQSVQDNGHYYNGVFYPAANPIAGYDASKGYTLSAVWTYGDHMGLATSVDINRIQLQLIRTSSGGLPVATVVLRPHTHSRISAGGQTLNLLAPSYTTTMSWGERKLINLPASFLSAFATGGAKGIAVVPPDSSSKYSATFERTSSLEFVANYS